MVAQNLGECQHPRRCGKYGLCSREGNCSCPIAVDGNQYFKQTESQQPDGGCSMITPLSCPSSPDQHRLVEVRNASYFNIIDPDSALSGIKDVERCKQACLQNCSCNAAIFRHDNNISDGYCYMPSEILSIRDGQIPNHNFTSATYVKVQIPPEERGGSPPPPPPTHRKNLTVILAGSGAGVLLIFIVIVIFWMKLGKTNTEEVDDYEYIRQVPGMPVMLSYEDLRIATEDFKERLGGGGFGLLVYEYLSNGSLENWIFYRDQKPCVDWETRKKIILDIARGLAYLHEECRQRIIHLDIKPQNILLDENFNAKISDFGLSKLVDRDESQILTTLRGTPGYIAPECGQSKITVKVDIYSFGIVLLETVSGRRNLDRTRSESSKHLLSMLPKKAEEDRLFDIVENLDEEVQGRREEVVRLIKIGAWCLQNDPTRRPLMSTVVKVLEGVMEVDPNINYKFTHAMAPSAVADDHVSTAPQPSVLSNPR
ncbi:hypothetical protein F0562_008546 [Nyssa sinensis]|uniref:non-specific serine/threonine protein kinase n=1 Tax=Nyssa sinensis TaxID=561372 RepID=A0A5J5AAB7_9ASTE|nr:hypothetical protein F0562_008546 [Nyssa sinensis]